MEKELITAIRVKVCEDFLTGFCDAETPINDCAKSSCMNCARQFIEGWQAYKELEESKGLENTITKVIE